MHDLALGYAELKDRVTELVRDVEDDALSLPVPACPDWSVQDLISHMVGVIDACLNMAVPDGLLSAWSPDADLAARGRQIGATWTGAMVRSRSDRNLGDLLREWDEHAAALFGMAADEIAAPPGVDVLGSISMCFGDTAAHWVDLCGALEVCFDTSDPWLLIAGRRHAERMLPARLAMNDLEPFALEATDVSERWGDPKLPVAVRGTAFELWRSLSGRRSRQQVQQLDWLTDSEPYLRAFINGTYPEDDQYP